jgi:hypothetical protein
MRPERVERRRPSAHFRRLPQTTRHVGGRAERGAADRTTGHDSTFQRKRGAMSEAKSVEIWFRGEGVGVPAAKAGGYLHDFGDGLYFSDKLQVAEVYARRRAKDPAGRRVWLVAVKRATLGQVLDLSADPRWTRFMNDTSDRMLLGRSRLYYLKLQHERYGQFFQEFLRLHKISLEKYDAVIGPEYNLGGRQLCILHKRGHAAPLQQRLRTQFRPAHLVQARLAAVGRLVRLKTGAIPLRPSAVASKTLRVVSARGSAAGNGRIGAGATAAGVGVALFEIAFQFLWPWLWQKYGLEPMLQQQIDERAPGVEADLVEQLLHAAHLRYLGGRAYANVTLHIKWTHTQSSSTPIDYHPGVSVPEFRGPADVNVTGRDIETQRDVSPSRGWGDDIFETITGVEIRYEQVTSSSEVHLAEGYQEFYNAVIEELSWYHDRLLGDGYSQPVGDARDSLLTGRQVVLHATSDYFGLDVQVVEKHFRDLFLL